MEASRPLPPSAAARIAALQRGELTPVVPRLAATVVLLRDGAGGLEVFLLRRLRTMRFARGMEVFPGGSVDAADAAPLPWTGPSAEALAARLGCPPEQARSLLHAAVRETFEEAGVLLAAPVGVGDGAGAWPAAELAADRERVLSGAEGFGAVLARRNLVVRADLLQPWSHWVTPEFEERRFDTWFFVAALPHGARTAESSGEADRMRWMRVADAVAGADARELPMMPPTVTTLREVMPYGTTAALLAAAAAATVRHQAPAVVAGTDGSYRLAYDRPGGAAAPGAAESSRQGSAS